jgi:hypothetical protein
MMSIIVKMVTKVNTEFSNTSDNLSIENRVNNGYR